MTAPTPQFFFFFYNTLFPDKTELLPPQNPLLCNQEQHEVGQPPHCITAHNQTATAQYCNCTALLQYCYCTAQAVTCIPAAYILLQHMWNRRNNHVKTFTLLQNILCVKTIYNMFIYNTSWIVIRLLKLSMINNKKISLLNVSTQLLPFCHSIW